MKEIMHDVCSESFVLPFPNACFIIICNYTCTVHFFLFLVIEQIKKDVAAHRLLVFRDQGIISGQRHVEISRWFGELESTFYKHPKSPHPDVFRVSNDRNEGCTGMKSAHTIRIKC
jgi:hypothetical protein